ncbi:MAG TPA: helix-turn-helix domain-containing protein [Steroidobacteraceae bacterium]|jgi:transcriptional regulator GlxA family with amidase domain
MKVDVLALENCGPGALGVTLDVLEIVNRLAQRTVFDWRVLCVEGSKARARGGLQIAAQSLDRARPRDLVIVLGIGALAAEDVRPRLESREATQAAKWLRQAWQSGSAVAASCTGVFLLGASGLLDDRRCTTTWWLVPTLAELYPSCCVEADAMVTEDRRVWTSGASFSHIDLMLSLATRFAGPELATKAARYLVVDQRASQARYVIPAFLAAQDPLATQVEGYVRKRLAQRIELDKMAGSMGTSGRTLSRRIRRVTGLSPMRFVQKIRVDAALHLLDTTRLPLAAIAERVGFSDPSALYRLTVRHTGRTPTEFRSR